MLLLECQLNKYGQYDNPQRAKKVVTDSLGLADFATGLVKSVFNLPDGKWCSLRNLNNRRTVKSILLVKKLLGLVEMKSGLVNANFSLPEWQGVKMIFFAPWSKNLVTHTIVQSTVVILRFQCKYELDFRYSYVIRTLTHGLFRCMRISYLCV